MLGRDLRVGAARAHPGQSANAERVKPVRHNEAQNIRRGATLSARFGQDGHPFRAPKRACAGGPAIPAYTTTTGSLKHM